MNKRDIVIGLILIAVVGVIIYFVRRPQMVPLSTPSPTPSVQEKIQNKFNVQIPENVDQAELNDVTGQGYSGLATRVYENGVFNLTVLADLPDLTGSQFYEAWVQRGNPGDTNYSLLALGRLQMVKGGYLLDYTSGTNYSDYNEVTVSLETTLGQLPEKVILQGSF